MQLMLDKGPTGFAKALAPLLFVAAAVVALTGDRAEAQAYPEEPVKIVVPYGPGGATSNFGQMLADGLSKRWGQPVIVENRPGAGASIGAAYVARSEPDGYTILLDGDSSFVTNEFIFKDLGYDPRADLEPVSLLAKVNYALVVSERLGISDFDSFVEKMRAEGANFNYGSVGGGDVSRLGMEEFKQKAELADIVEIPYTGMANAVQGLLAGDHDMMLVSVRTIQPHLDSGAAVPLAISGDARAPGLPDIPTFSEVGYPEVRVGFFLAAGVPAGTDQEIIDEIANAMKEVLADPKVQETYVEQLGYELVGSVPDEFRAFVEEERERVSGLIESLGIERK